MTFTLTKEQMELLRDWGICTMEMWSNQWTPADQVVLTTIRQLLEGK